MISAEDYLKHAEPDLARLTEGFFTNPTTETWTNLEMLLEGAAWLNDMLSVVGNCKERPENWESYANLTAAIQQELAKLSQAVVRKENIQIGDSIRDGLIPNFEALQVEIGKTIDAKGIRAILS